MGFGSTDPQGLTNDQETALSSYSVSYALSLMYPLAGFLTSTVNGDFLESMTPQNDQATA